VQIYNEKRFCNSLQIFKLNLLKNVNVGMLICVTLFGCMKNGENDFYIYKRLDDYVVMR